MIQKSISHFILLVSFTCYVNSADTVYYELWDISSLESIGGHALTVIGNPEVVSTDIGNAVEFDGDGDMLLIENNPLGDAKEFTVEVVFKPDAGINIQNEPRFIHIGEANNERVMMEIRVNNNDEWYLDGFMKTDIDDLTLIDDTKTHPTNDWMHAAITFSNDTFTTFVNGEEELSDKVEYSNLIVKTLGQTSIGARMNQKNWYSGLVKYLKITHKALNPEDFMKIEEDIDTTDDNPTEINFTFLEQNIMIYPNPANQFINISFNKPVEGNAQIAIINVLGEQILGCNFKLHKKNNMICVEDLAEGFYFINVKTEKDFYSNKLIIKH
ncbi:LamG-like jellyroll fold domain-containing protein [Bacteroidota bacterium]